MSRLAGARTLARGRYSGCDTTACCGCRCAAAAHSVAAWISGCACNLVLHDGTVPRWRLVHWQPAMWAPPTMKQTGTPSESSEIRVEQVAHLYATLPLSIAANLAVGACVVACLAGVVSDVGLAAWIALFSAAAAIRLSAYLMVRRRGIDVAAVGRWESLFVLGACATGAMWPAALVVLGTASLPESARWYASMIVVVACAGVAAAGAYTMAQRLVPARLFIGTVLLPTFVFFIGGDRREQALAILVLIFLGFLYRSSTFAHDVMLNNLVLRREAVDNEERYRLLFDRSPLPMWVYDETDQRFLAVNDRAVARYGYVREEFERMTLADIRPPEEGAGKRHAPAGSGDSSDECRHRTRSGEIIDVAVWSTPMSLGQRAARITLVQDITGRKRLEAELRELATTDPLTALPNRRHFLAQLDAELERLRRHPHHRVALLMMDLDHFKRVNDLHGHTTGDAVLRQFAELLRDESRRLDTAARVGGEEFAVLLPEADLSAAEAIGERVRRKAMDPVHIEGQPAISVTVSIGIGLMDGADGSGSAVLGRADKALYQAKARGRNRIEVQAESQKHGEPRAATGFRDADLAIRA